MAGAIKEGRATLDTLDKPVFLIDDIREIQVGLDDIIATASQGSRGSVPVWHHPNLRGVLFITTNKLFTMAAAGLNSLVFGNLNAKTFGSLEEALAYVESQG